MSCSTPIVTSWQETVLDSHQTDRRILVHLAHVPNSRLPRPPYVEGGSDEGFAESQTLYIIKARVHGPLTGIRGVSCGWAKHHKAGAKNSFGFSELADRRAALVLPMGNT